MDTLLNRVTIESSVCNGKPTIRGKRITVQTILEFLSSGDSIDEILHQYPTLEHDDINACIKFATELMSHQYSVKAFAWRKQGNLI